MRQFYHTTQNAAMKFKPLTSILLFTVCLIAQKVVAQPAIGSFTPSSGVAGTAVTITGTNFGATPATNTVYFGAAKAVVNTASATSLSVTVPAGATYLPITVTVNNLTGYSNSPFIITFAGGGTAFTAGSFVEKIDFSTGDQPVGVAIGDLDGDGKPDIAVTNANAATVSIFKNNGTTGTISFETKADFTAGLNPQYVSIGDIDGDGKLDLAIANEASNTVSVLRNTTSGGSISFAAKVDFETRRQPNSVSIGDIDGDGKPDIAVANGETYITLLRNTGTAGIISFAPKSDFISGTGPWRIAIQDLDADGKPDLAVSGNGLLSIFRNTSAPGAFTFATRADIVTGTGYGTIATGDLDGDGKPDIATANAKDPNTGTISLFRNTSTTGNIAFANKIDKTTEPGATSICMSDIDGDGKPDIAVTNAGTPIVSVFRNTGTIGTISLDTKIDYATGTGPFGVSAADLDGDSKPDLAIADSVSNTLSILRNQIDDALPVTLLNFSGRLSANEIKLQWQTAIEQNSANFIVEYAADGILFIPIGTVKAAGSSNGLRSYSFTHTQPKNGSNYYRLKIVNADAKFTNSNTININFSLNNLHLNAYPNPAKNYVVVDHPASVNAAQLTLVDMAGRAIKTIKVIKDAVQTTLNIKAVMPGTYKIVWSDGKNTLNKTIVIE